MMDVTGHRVEEGFGLTEAAPGVATTVGHPILGAGHVQLQSTGQCHAKSLVEDAAVVAPAA